MAGEGDRLYGMKAVPEKRWQEAQKHELDFWRHWRDLSPYRKVDLDAYWKGEQARFHLPAGYFHGKRVLDVGCGPVGLIHFVEAAWRVRLDPLLHEYQEKLPLPAPGSSIVSTAERLPLAPRSFDVAICFNALDHMRDPRAALKEISRVLRPGWRLLLMVHTFPAWIMPLLAADRMHPHHWTERAFLGLVAGSFKIVQSCSVPRTFAIPPRDRFRPSCWKYLAAGLVLATTYVAAESAI